jgi:glycine dehydrogenase subunit 1
VVTSTAVHPEYREILEVYLRNVEAELVVVDADADGVSAALIDAIDDQTACVLIQHPNFFGRLEDVPAIVETARDRGALVIQSFDPISLGLLKRPGDMGVDIAVADGPYLGIMACREELVRRLPGRLAGQTADRRGNRCWVLTLQTREQHIRREKATSNICSNQTLLALRASVYLSLLGPQGLRETAEHCLRKTAYAREAVAKLDRFQIVHEGPVFKEFVVRDLADDVDGLLRHAEASGVLAGVPLRRFDESLGDCFVIAVTEKRTRGEIDSLVAVLESAPAAVAV